MKEHLAHECALAKALLTVQKALQPVAKSGQNSHLKSSYATLPDVLDELFPLCHANGILVVQPTLDCDDSLRVKVETTVLHVESGERQSFVTPMATKDSTAQAHGSAITYARRYALMSFFGIRASDDDGHQASQAPKPPPDNRPAIKTFAEGAEQKAYPVRHETTGKFDYGKIEAVVLGCNAITRKYPHIAETFKQVGITGVNPSFWKEALALLPVSGG